MVLSWDQLFQEEIKKEYFINLRKFVLREREAHNVFPKKEELFAAFDKTDFEKVKVVIIGQDPYHTPGVANGLAFSVNKACKIPPSLRNIYIELENDLKITGINHGDLSYWAKQGVLLMNSVLTVREACPNSHKGMGWEIFTDTVIDSLAAKEDGIIFILWGRYAQAKKEIINKYKNNFIIESAHPSPLSATRGFFGSRPFSRVNKILKDQGKEVIDWDLRNEDVY